MLMLSLSMSVITWQHVVGHTYTTAQSMHMANIMILTSISTCTGSVLFFIGIALISMWNYMTPNCWGNPPLPPWATPKPLSVDDVDTCTDDLAPSDIPPPPIGDTDIDAKAYALRAQSQTKSIGDTVVAARVLRGDILTITMVWTNIYGLGIASFFMSFIATMASSLCTFSCLVSMSVISLYEAYRERSDPLSRGWDNGKPAGKIREALHVIILTMSIASMCTIGAHVGGVHINAIGYIKQEDIFLGIIGPVITPFLLKIVRRPHITTISTLETSLPFTMLLCVTFMATGLALGMRPYESSNELARNITAATTLLPLSSGVVLVYLLHCIYRRRMIYIFSTFMVVFAGREITVSKNSSVVVAAFFLQLLAFILTIIASTPRALGYVAGMMNGNEREGKRHGEVAMDDL